MSEVPGTLPPTSVASLESRRARQRRLLLVFCGLSLGLHIGLVAGWIFAPSRAKPAVDLDQAIVKTRLVKLGKERPPDWLPRIDAAPPPPPKHKRAKPQDEKKKPDQEKPDAKDKPTAADILKDFEKKNEEKSVTDIIKDRIGEATDEGKKDGDKDGSALDGEIKKTYFTSLIAHIRRHMEVSNTITDEERIRLKATLSIKVGADGEVLDAKIAKSSGNSIFDNDVITAAKRSSPVPAPPPPVRDLVEAGVGINFCPVSCN